MASSEAMLSARAAERQEAGTSLVLRARFRVWPGCPEAPQIVAVSTQSRRFDGGAPHSVVSMIRAEAAMDAVYERCCGLDIHKKVVVACLITPGPEGRRKKEIRSFETMTADLLELSDWLLAAGCTHVAMESTGVF